MAIDASGVPFDRRQWASRAARRADGTFVRTNFAGRRDSRSRAERREAVARLLPRFGSCRQVARRLGVNEDTVRKDAHELGLAVREAACSPGNRLRAAERALQAKELYEQGRLGMEQIAHELGISERQVSRYLHRLGIDIRPAGHPPLYPPAEEHKCPVCGRTYTPKPWHVAAGKYKGCNASHGMKVRVERVGLPEEFIHPHWAPNKRRKWRGKKAGRKPPSAGARPRGRPRTAIPAADVQKVRQLKLDHPEWGERTIARAAKLSRYQVGRILSEPEDDERQEAA